MSKLDNTAALSNGEWQQRLGQQIRQLRLRENLSQAEIARRANIDRTTVVRIEAGEGGSVSSLVGIARALGRDGWLDDLAPAAATISPMELLREQQRAPRRQRKRASREPASAS